MRRGFASRLSLSLRVVYSQLSYWLMNPEPLCSTSTNKFCTEFFVFAFGVPLCVSLNYLILPLSLLISIFLLLLGLWFCFRFLEHLLVYACNEPPSSKFSYMNPSNFGFPTWELVKLHPDGKNGPVVVGFFLLQPSLSQRKTCPVVLLLHGNAGNSTARLPMCQVLENRFHCNIFIIDYRGYGQSTGRPSEAGLYADAQCAVDYLFTRCDINNQEIFVIGRSLGGALAVYLASNPTSSRKICGVIIENTFTSIPDTASHILNIPWRLPSRLFSNQYSSLIRLQICGETRKSASLFPPMLLVSGELDKIIPPKMMWKLAEAYEKILAGQRTPSDCHTKCSSLSQDPNTFILSGTDGLVSFPDGNHNDTWICNHWSDVILRFIEQSSLRVKNDFNENGFNLCV